MYLLYLSAFTTLFLAPLPYQTRAHAATAAERSHAYLKKIKSIPYAYTDLRVNDRIAIRGIPGSQHNLNITQLSSDEIKQTLFRHYTTAELKPKVLQSGALKAGPVAYVNSPYIFIDLTGVFLTLTHCTPESVGLSSTSHSAAIDLKVSSDFPVLRIEKCIYLIPGPAPKPAWMNDSEEPFAVPF